MGTFYRFTGKEQFVPLKNSIGVSNGLSWNEKTNKFYYIDSVDHDVKEFDYDPKSGNICEFSNRAEASVGEVLAQTSCDAIDRCCGRLTELRLLFDFGSLLFSCFASHATIKCCLCSGLMILSIVGRISTLRVHFFPLLCMLRECIPICINPYLVYLHVYSQ